MESTGAEIDWEGTWPPMAPLPAPVEVDLNALMMESPFDASDDDYVDFVDFAFDFDMDNTTDCGVDDTAEDIWGDLMAS